MWCRRTVLIYCVFGSLLTRTRSLECQNFVFTRYMNSIGEYEINTSHNVTLTCTTPGDVCFQVEGYNASGDGLIGGCVNSHACDDCTLFGGYTRCCMSCCTTDFCNGDASFTDCSLTTPTTTTATTTTPTTIITTITATTTTNTPGTSTSTPKSTTSKASSTTAAPPVTPEPIISTRPPRTTTVLISTPTCGSASVKLGQRTLLVMLLGCFGSWVGLLGS